MHARMMYVMGFVLYSASFVQSAPFGEQWDAENIWRSVSQQHHPTADSSSPPFELPLLELTPEGSAPVEDHSEDLPPTKQTETIAEKEPTLLGTDHGSAVQHSTFVSGQDGSLITPVASAPVPDHLAALSPPAKHIHSVEEPTSPAKRVKIDKELEDARAPVVNALFGADRGSDVQPSESYPAHSFMSRPPEPTSTEGSGTREQPVILDSSTNHARVPNSQPTRTPSNPRTWTWHEDKPGDRKPRKKKFGGHKPW